jgi:hypothetical protein
VPSACLAAIFIPAVAIAGTLIVVAIFAWDSHLHGSYLKQLAEIRHRSVEYRNELGRKIALAIASVLLLIAFVTIVWIRYVVIADQLGVSASTSEGTFGGASTSMVWSRLGPTIVLNILIWGLGTLYAWAVNEKVPELRESYRELLRAHRKLDGARARFFRNRSAYMLCTLVSSKKPKSPSKNIRILWSRFTVCPSDLKRSRL